MVVDKTTEATMNYAPTFEGRLYGDDIGLEGLPGRWVRRAEYDALAAQSDARTQELESLLRDIAPGLRDILWCALVWNDHNFTERDLLDKATRAAKSMGIDRHNGVDAVNHWMARVDRALKNGEQNDEV